MNNTGQNEPKVIDKVNQNELHSEQKQKWQQTLLKYLNLTEIKTKHILDIGTGPGFFAIILTQLGFKVTAIDYTAEMLLKKLNKVPMSYK